MFNTVLNFQQYFYVEFFYLLQLQLSLRSLMDIKKKDAIDFKLQKYVYSDHRLIIQPPRVKITDKCSTIASQDYLNIGVTKIYANLYVTYVFTVN